MRPISMTFMVGGLELLLSIDSETGQPRTARLGDVELAADLLERAALLVRDLRESSSGPRQAVCIAHGYYSPQERPDGRYLCPRCSPPQERRVPKVHPDLEAVADAQQFLRDMGEGATQDSDEAEEGGAA